MGRSVAVPGNAAGTVYIDVTEYDQDTWDDFIEDVRNVVREKYPSFAEIDQWVGRETRAILSNHHCLVVVAEYCGLASVSIGCNNNEALSSAWCRRIASSWRAHMHKRYASTAYVHQATASNGEAFYRKAI